MTEREAAVRRCNDELIKRYGAVVRARGPYLYTQKGVRLTDLYLDAGRAVLGRGCSGSNAFRVFKNTLERGETASFPSAYNTRFQNAVLSLVPGYDYAAWFSSEASLLQAAASYLSKDGNTALPASQAESTLRVKLWRPWQSESPDSAKEAPCETLGGEPLPAGGTEAEMEAGIQTGTEAVPVAEGMLALYPPLALQEAGIIAVFKAVSEPFPPSDLCSGALLNALTRSIYDLKREIPKRGEKEWSRFDTVLGTYFARTGPYLSAKINGDRYDEFVRHCLDCTLLIPPYPELAIVPHTASEGDFSRLKRNPFK